MSVDTFIILRDDRLPTRAQWQRGMDDAGIDLRLSAIDDLRLHSGYWPVKFNGADSGFEWYFGKVVDIFGSNSISTGGREHAINFVTHSYTQELICALYAAGSLAKIGNGWFFDEEANDLVSGDRAIEIAAEIWSAENERKKSKAAQDAALTKLRCAKCGAPCPSYRKTCKACGVAVERTT